MRWFAMILLASCAQSAPVGHAVEMPPIRSARTIDIAVTSHGFEPNSIDVAKGETATIVFTRTVQHTCVKRVVVTLDDRHNVERDLPVGQPIGLTLTFDRVGEVGFSCAMMMQGGTIRVHDRL